MSEDRNEAGQFTPSTDGLFGNDLELAEAGYKPMPDRPKEDVGEFETARDAANELSASRQDAPIVEVSYLKTDTGEKVDDNEAVTAERAARDLTAYRNARVDNGAKSISSEFAAELDKMRADAIKGNPKVAEHYGVEVPAEAGEDLKAERANNNKSGEETADDSTANDAIDAIDGLDPETRKALKIPQVRQALEQEFSEANKVRESYSAALSQAQSFAQASFVEGFPELAGLPAAQLEQGLAMLAQVDPPRFNAAMGVLNRVYSIQTAQQQEQQQRAYAAHQQFESQRQQFSKQADEALGPMTRAEKMQMADELADYVGRHGVSREQFVREAESNIALHHPAFQAMAADAIRYQRMMSASKARPSVPLPPVQRPGMSQPNRGSDNSSKIQALERQLSTATSNKAIRIAAQIQGLRRAASNR